MILFPPFAGRESGRAITAANAETISLLEPRRMLKDRYRSNQKQQQADDAHLQGEISVLVHALHGRP
jgi:hypothetical protein